MKSACCCGPFRRTGYREAYNTVLPREADSLLVTLARRFCAGVPLGSVRFAGKGRRRVWWRGVAGGKGRRRGSVGSTGCCGERDAGLSARLISAAGADKAVAPAPLPSRLLPLDKDSASERDEYNILRANGAKKEKQIKQSERERKRDKKQWTSCWRRRSKRRRLRDDEGAMETQT